MCFLFHWHFELNLIGLFQHAVLGHWNVEFLVSFSILLMGSLESTHPTFLLCCRWHRRELVLSWPLTGGIITDTLTTLAYSLLEGRTEQP